VEISRGTPIRLAPLGGASDLALELLGQRCRTEFSDHLWVVSRGSCSAGRHAERAPGLWLRPARLRSFGAPLAVRRNLAGSGPARTSTLSRLLARCCVLVGCVDVFGAFSSLQGLPRPSAAAAPLIFRVLGKPQEAELRGEIGDGASSVLARGLAQNPSVRVLHLRSPGGLVNEGLRLGNLIRQHGLEVVVDTQCSSACTLALLAADVRWTRAEARIGFHRAVSLFSLSSPLSSSLSPSAQNAFTTALRQVGAGEEFIDRVTATPPEEIWTPSLEELQAAHVVTGIASDDQFVYCPAAMTAPELASELQDRPILQEIKRVNSERYLELAEQYLATPTEGLTLFEARARLTESLSKETRTAECRAPPSLAPEHAQLMAALAHAFATNAPQDCLALLKGSLHLGDVTPELVNRYNQFEAKFYVASRDAAPAPPNSRDQARARQVLVEHLSAATRKTIIESMDGKPVPQPEICRAAAEYYDVVTGLDPPVIASVMRPASCGSETAH